MIVKKNNVERKVLKTFSLFYAYSLMGFSSSLLGTNFVYLKNLFSVSEKEISISIFFHNIGYLSGGLSCYFFYDKVPNKEIIFFFSNSLACLSIISAGQSGKFIVFNFFISLMGVAFGYNDAAAQSYCLQVWDNNTWKKIMLETMHTFWSLGGILGPLFHQLFLHQLPEELINRSSNSTDAFASNKSFFNSSDKFFNKSEVIEILEMSRHSFSLVSCLFFSSLFPFIIDLALKSKSVKNSSPDETEGKKELEKIKNLKKKNPRHLIAVLYVFISIFSMLILYLEYLPQCYLVLFSMNWLGMHIDTSSKLLSFFYISHFLGRMITILSTLHFSPKSILCFHLSVSLISYFISIAFIKVYPFIIWLSVVLAGFGISSVFPTMVLWIGERIEISGKIGGLMIVSCNLSTCSGPFLMAFLFQNFGYFSYKWIMLLFSILILLLFFTQMIFVDKYFKKQIIL